MTYDPFVRVFLEESNAEATVRRSFAEVAELPILEGHPALASGTPMPAKFRTSVAEKVAEKKKDNPTGSDSSPSPKEEASK